MNPPHEKPATLPQEEIQPSCERLNELFAALLKMPTEQEASDFLASLTPQERRGVLACDATM